MNLIKVYKTEPCSYESQLNINRDISLKKREFSEFSKNS